MARENSGDSGGPALSRRQVLRGGGVAAVGTVGLASASQPVHAGWKSSCEEPPMWIPRVSTRGHFDTTWWGSVYRTNGNTATNYDFRGGDVPGVHAPPEDDLVVYVHGWTNTDESACCNAGEIRDAYAFHGYDQPVIGYSWDSDYWWSNAQQIADYNGVKLAQFAVDYAADNPEVTLRWVGHSLGCRVVLEALKTLHEWGETDVLTSLTLLGGAVDNDSVAMDGRYGNAIADTVDHCDNFWMNDDSVLNYAYATWEWSTAIGASPVSGTAPVNYTDHNVDYVDGHSDHYTVDGCMDEVIETY